MREILLLGHKVQSGPSWQTEPWNYHQFRPEGFLESVAALELNSRESAGKELIKGFMWNFLEALQELP